MNRGLDLTNGYYFFSYCIKMIKKHRCTEQRYFIDFIVLAKKYSK